jgi:hypothetical protein
MRLRIKAVFLGCLLLATSACAPQVYLIDRQTILELEASGSWPELDAKYKNASLKAGATALESTDDKAESRKVFSMTHDDKSAK